MLLYIIQIDRKLDFLLYVWYNLFIILFVNNLLIIYYYERDIITQILAFYNLFLKIIRKEYLRFCK